MNKRRMASARGVLKEASLKKNNMASASNGFEGSWFHG